MQARDGANQIALIDGFGHIAICVKGKEAFPVARHRIGGQRDHRNVPVRGIACVQQGERLHPVHQRHMNVEQDNVEHLARQRIKKRLHQLREIRALRRQSGIGLHVNLPGR